MKKAVCRKYDLSINRFCEIWCIHFVPEFPIWFWIKNPKSNLRNGFDKVVCKINFWKILNSLLDQYTRLIFLSVNCIVPSQMKLKHLNIYCDLIVQKDYRVDSLMMIMSKMLILLHISTFNDKLFRKDTTYKIHLKEKFSIS